MTPAATQLVQYPVRTHANALEYGRRVASRLWREADEKERASGALAVHFDIDSTLLDEAQPFVLGDDEFLMPNRDIVELLMHCMRTGFKIVIITARAKQHEDYTRTNLALFAIPYHALIFSGRKPEWKRSLREKRGIRTVMSVGDNLVDVQGGAYAGVPILLKTPGQRSFR